MFLGAAVDGVLKGLAAGVVPVTHAALILLPGRAHHAVTAHFLLVERHRLHKYPLLSTSTRKYPCVLRKCVLPAGNIMNKKKAALDPDEVDRLVFLADRPLFLLLSLVKVVMSLFALCSSDSV